MVWEKKRKKIERAMVILITGANGQLGNEMRRVSAQSSNRYIFTDVAELDITDREAVLARVEAEKVEVIVNCAAYTNVEKAEEDYERADLLNNRAVENLALAARAVGATMIHVSTDYVFKGDSCVPYFEDMDTDPLGVYGSTKLAGERALIASGCRYLIFRTAWLYSPFGNNFVKTMRRLTAERESLNVVFDQVGTPTYAGDLAALIYHVIESGQLEKEGIYHYSDEGVCSWYDFAKEIAELSGYVCDIRPCHSEEFPSKVERPHFSVLDKTKVKKTFGVTVPYWKDSLRKCVNELSEKEGKDER